MKNRRKCHNWVWSNMRATIYIKNTRAHSHVTTFALLCVEKRPKNRDSIWVTGRGIIASLCTAMRKKCGNLCVFAWFPDFLTRIEVRRGRTDKFFTTAMKTSQISSKWRAISPLISRNALIYFQIRLKKNDSLVTFLSPSKPIPAFQFHSLY